MKTMGIFAVVLLVVSIGFGIWIGVTGKPYSIGLFTVHKLSGIGFTILTIIIVVNRIRSCGFAGLNMVFAIAFGITIIALLSTGAIMSGDKATTAFLRVVHIASTVVSVISGGGLLMFLVR